MADVFQHSTALSWLPPPDETKIIVREFPVNRREKDSYSLSSATRTVHTALYIVFYSVAIDIGVKSFLKSTFYGA